MDKQDWIISIGLAIIIAIGAYQVYGMIYGARADKADMPPTQEISRTNKAADAVQEKIIIYQQAQQKLPEVIDRAKQSAQSSVDALDDGGVADSWNARLGKYRQHHAAPAGIPAQ